MEHGVGKIVTLNGEIFFHEGSAVIIPAGTEHQITNTGNQPLQLYSIYTAPLHAPNTVEEKDFASGEIKTIS